MSVHSRTIRERRRFSLPEFKRFGSFPDGFIFAGEFEEGIKQIGDCVPPLFVHNLMDDGLTMVPIRQGFASMTAPTAEMLSLIRAGRLIHNNNPCLNWMADSFAVKQDPAGNIKPSKPDRSKSKKKIDGIVAGINALARWIASPENQGSV
jgi:hypothetical protein